MADRSDGGPAFPRSDAEYPNTQEGMSLRDWLAGQTLAGMLGGVNPDWPLSEELAARRAESAYLQADAMLARRQKAGA